MDPLIPDPPPPPASYSPSTSLTIEPPNEESLKSLRRINALLLPVAYPENVYSSILSSPVDSILTRLAFWESECVGGIRCRLELSHDEDDEQRQYRKIYIMTLAVLGPFRRLGVARELVNYIVESAAKMVRATEVYAHVWTANEDGLDFYKNIGFDTETGEVISGYYRRLKPNEARVVMKKVS